jgi:butyrate kinase
MLTEWIRERVGFLGRLLVYPGEDEMRALAEGVLRVLQGEETARDY